MANPHAPYFIPIRTRRPADMNSLSSADSTYGSGSSETGTPSATHDISRVKYHVKHLETFAQTLQESASRAFPNRGRSSQRYSKVQALLLHWKSDDLFVLPELEDLEKCLREDFSFETDVFAIPSENSHLELMLKLGDMIKKHESEETLFLIYYGGHARIDDSRQSTWCATRQSGSPWLQWSAIQTLLERSISDTLILLDCCAGAASATFPNGQSITETISASSWDAIAPDPGRYSFTNALIEVLSEWSNRTFSAAMLHAEILARLKHPRPIMINGKHFEARSTPVHFMMTSNHKAPSIEFSRIIPESQKPPSPPADPPAPQLGRLGFQGDVSSGELQGASEPSVDEPHVMISLALEDDQRLDLNAWEQWLASFPALAKHVKVQGVFQSHSTLLLLSLPVMIWDLLPEDPACSFVAFIRSNNLLRQAQRTESLTSIGVSVSEGRHLDIHGGYESDSGSDADTEKDDTASVLSGTTFSPDNVGSILGRDSLLATSSRRRSTSTVDTDILRQRSRISTPGSIPGIMSGGAPSRQLPLRIFPAVKTPISTTSSKALPRLPTPSTDLPDAEASISEGPRPGIARTMISTKAKSSRTRDFSPDKDLPESPRLARHVVDRLEEYFQELPRPDAAVTDFLASNLGVEPSDVDLWFHYRRQHDLMTSNLQNLQIHDHAHEATDGTRMILPGHLQTLLDVFPTKRILVVDLRSPAAFEKSHIHEAINLRVPVTFAENASLEMIQDTFTDDQSRRTFAKWSQSRCVVLYDRVVEFDWECPVADILLEKFRRAGGWTGQCFILKGHYHEFSSSFNKYISGTKMTQDAKDYVDSLRQRPSQSSDQIQETEARYMNWLARLEDEDRMPTELIPSKKAERIRSVNEHQRELEAELDMRFPALFRKVQALGSPNMPPSYGVRTASADSSSAYGDGDKKKGVVNDDAAFDSAQAQLVAPLSRGLAKMEEAGLMASDQTGTPGYPYHHTYQAGNTDKLGEQQHHWVSDDYEEIDKDDTLKGDPAFQRAGAKLLHEGDMEDTSLHRRGGRGPLTPQQSFWKRLRPGPK